MRAFLRLLLPALFVPALLQAQTSVQGRITSADGESVIAATVILSGNSVQRTAATDSAGHFIFYDVAPGSYRLRAERIGYLPVERTLTVAQTVVSVDLELTDAPVAIEAVTAEGARQRSRFENQAGVTTRELSKAELKLIPGLAEADVMRAIEAMPGVVSTSDFSSAFNVRGGSTDQNLILLDGIPLYNPFHLGGVFSIFNSDMVERAELLAGGFPAEYGGRVSSVLNVISDVGQGGFHVEGGVSILATRVAVAGELSQSAAKRLGISSARFRIGGRRSYFDQLLKPFFDFPYHLTDLQFGGEIFTSPSSRISTTAYIGNDVLGFAGIDSFPLAFKFQWGNKVGGVAWTKTLKNTGSVDVRTSYSRFDTFITFPDFGDTRFTSKIDHALIKGGVTLPVGRHQFKAGAELDRLWYANRAETGGTVFRHGTDTGVQTGLYAQMSLRPTSRWLIETGIREDVWDAQTTSHNISTLAPRLAVKRFFSNGDAAFKLAVGRYTQFLHSLRQEDFPIGLDVWVLTGARAPHVVSDQIQSGVEWFPSAGWYAALEAYYRKFDGVATNNFADDPNTDTDDLLSGDGRSYGADAVLRKDKGRLRGFITVSYLRATRTFPDILATQDPPPRVKYPPIFDRRLEVDMVVRVDLPWRWEGGLRWNIGTGLPYTRPIASYLYFDYRISDGRVTTDDRPDSAAVAVLLQERNRSRYPTYHRLDFSARKTLRTSWGTITPHVDVLNIYNRKNVLFYFYDFNRQPAVRSGVSMFPFLPTIGAEVTLR